MVKLVLAEVLKQKKISKRRFAKLLGVDYGNVFRYFRPGYDPKLSSLSKWARALNLHVRDFIKEE